MHSLTKLQSVIGEITKKIMISRRTAILKYNIKFSSFSSPKMQLVVMVRHISFFKMLKIWESIPLVLNILSNVIRLHSKKGSTTERKHWMKIGSTWDVIMNKFFPIFKCYGVNIEAVYKSSEQNQSKNQLKSMMNQLNQSDLWRNHWIKCGAPLIKIWT